MCESIQSPRVAIGKMLMAIGSVFRLELVQIQLHRRNVRRFEIRFSRLPCCWPQASTLRTPSVRVTDKKYRNVDIKRASKAGLRVSKFYQDEADRGLDCLFQAR